DDERERVERAFLSHAQIAEDLRIALHDPRLGGEIELVRLEHVAEPKRRQDPICSQQAVEKDQVSRLLTPEGMPLLAKREIDVTIPHRRPKERKPIGRERLLESDVGHHSGYHRALRKDAPAKVSSSRECEHEVAVEHI